MNFLFLVIFLLIVFIILRALSRQKKDELEGWKKFSRTYKAKEKYSALLGSVEKCYVCGIHGNELEGIKEGKKWFCSKECKEKWEAQKKN